MSGQQVSQIIGVLVIFYLAGLLGIARYLKAKHPSVWQLLGSPSLLNWSISSSLRLGSYVLFSGAHRQLTDQRLTFAIYGERILLLVVVLVIAYWKLYY